MRNFQIQAGMPNTAEIKLVNYARNNLAQRKNVNLYDPVLKRFRFTKMKFLTEVTNYRCRKEGAAKKLENELKYLSLPEMAIESILDKIEFVTEEFNTLQDCQVNNKKGVLYKIFYSMVEQNQIICVAMMVNVVKFDAHIVKGVEEVKKPIYENSTTVGCYNFLGFNRKYTREKKKIIGHEITKFPKIHGMNDEEIESCMKYLEFQTCKKLLQVSDWAKGVEAIDAIELEQERIGEMSDKSKVLSDSDPAALEESILVSTVINLVIVALAVVPICLVTNSGTILRSPSWPNVPIIVCGRKLSI